MTTQRKLSQHAEWLSLVEVSGPFLAEPILDKAFPQGLEKIHPLKKKRFRQAYDEWRETIDSHLDEDLAISNQIHKEWINWVIKFGLEWDEDEDGDILKSGEAIPGDIRLDLPEHGISLGPEFVVYADGQSKPYILVTSYPAATPLEEPVKGESWSTTPAERMAQLCKSVGTRLGLVTNGEQWLFVDAPDGGIATYSSWYARLWSQEPVTLQAFYSLLNIGTIFNGFEDARKLTELLDESLKHQDEVTETLGEQVSRAVEVLIQSLDRINHDHNGKLLEGVEPTELYEAGLTLMMRLVFLLCAEERGLLLLGDETYESNYALSTLRLKLKVEADLHGEEVLSFRKNAWSRLLAIFRAVYGGIDHENMRMPALGGSLFDPDRFPFLEGRPKDSKWKVEAAKPLPIDNRTVLLFLDAIQIYQGRTLSYRALDVEQIGYVYEGLLEKTVVRAPDVTLELKGSKSAKQPWVELKELASAELDGDAAVKKLLKERTKSTAGRINADLDKELTDTQLDKLLAACHNDTELKDRLKPYYHFLRLDAWANPLVYPKDAFMVTTGTDRRETGTHYTPKSLTESIVKETLEPIVYIGPAIGEPKDKWRLKSSAELQDLKICDLAMGSGAFLVQVCRWLAERVCEAWLIEEQNGKAISAEGEASVNQPEESLPVDAEERLVIAKRLIAERCLYGVDVNPLAVELAKLSIWLVTLSKGRPFGFLDHNLKHGDSLLGLHDLNQLYYLDMNPSKLSEGGGSAKQLFAQDIEKAVEEALEIRKQIRMMPIRDIHDVEMMANMEREAEEKLALPSLAADALIGEVLANKGKQPDTGLLGVRLGEVFSGSEPTPLKNSINENLKIDLDAAKPIRKPFHWCMEFPEVFLHGGFNAIVGNPPFLGGQKITGAMGTCFRDYIVNTIAKGKKGSADLVAYFFIRANSLLANEGCFGLVAVNTISEGNTREVGLDTLTESGADIFLAMPNLVWPGSANVVTSSVFVSKEQWGGIKFIHKTKCEVISTALTSRENWRPVKLVDNLGVVFQGVIILGDGFLLGSEQASNLIKSDSKYRDVIYPYLTGNEVNTHPKHLPGRWVINFYDWTEEESSNYEVAFNKVVEEVKPLRQEIKKDGSYKLRDPLPKYWWRYERGRPNLFHVIGRGEHYSKRLENSVKSSLEKVIVFATQATKYPCFTIVPNEYIFSNALCVIASESYSLFTVLSSDIHGVWAWEHGSRMKQDLRYTHGDIFETFPFPKGVIEGESKVLDSIGNEFFSLRAKYMAANDKGMTKLYNELHDDALDSSSIRDLREKQVELNDAVLKAYGYTDIDPEYGFHEVAYLPEGKNVRYTISEKVREEVLYRLSMLNKERHEKEAVESNKKNTKKTTTKNNQAELF